MFGAFEEHSALGKLSEVASDLLAAQVSAPPSLTEQQKINAGFSSAPDTRPFSPQPPPPPSLPFQPPQPFQPPRCLRPRAICPWRGELLSGEEEEGEYSDEEYGAKELKKDEEYLFREGLDSDDDEDNGRKRKAKSGVEKSVEKKSKGKKSSEMFEAFAVEAKKSRVDKTRGLSVVKGKKSPSSGGSSTGQGASSTYLDQLGVDDPLEEFKKKNLKSLPVTGTWRQDRSAKVREICGDNTKRATAICIAVRAWQQGQDKKHATEFSAKVIADNEVKIAEQAAMIVVQASTTEVHVAEIEFKKEEIERLKNLLTDNNIDFRLQLFSSCV